MITNVIMYIIYHCLLPPYTNLLFTFSEIWNEKVKTV